MASALREWRRRRREADFWVRARDRSRTMLEGEIVQNIDLALMAGSQAISRYRQSQDHDAQDVQLHELRMQLEASLGMLDNVLPEP